MRDLFPVSGSRHERLAAIAELQRGRVARRQLLAAGIGAGAIDNMLRQGLLHREHAGVYAVLDTAARPLASETAALLACGDRAVLSHRTAAALWALVPTSERPIQVTVVGRETGRRRSGIEMHRTGRLLARDVRIEQHLPVTSPARTLLDIAAQTPTAEYEHAVDEALVVLKIVRLHELEDVAKRAVGRIEGPILADMLNRRGPAAITQSEAERRFLKLIRDAGLPQPETQVRVAGFEVDFFWREQRVAFEVDGYRYHTSRYSFDRDRRKDAALKAVDIDPNRVTRDQVFHQPLSVIAYVATALARATRGRDRYG